MTKDEFGIALRNPQLLPFIIDNKAQLSRKERKQLEQYINAMTGKTEKHNAAQNALSKINIYSGYKIDQTLTASAHIKMARHPNLPSDAMDEIDAINLKMYIEASVAVAAKAYRDVVDSLDD